MPDNRTCNDKQASHAVERQIEGRPILGSTNHRQHFRNRDVHGVAVVAVGRNPNWLVWLALDIAVMGVSVVAVTMQMNVGPRCMMLRLGYVVRLVGMTKTNALSGEQRRNQDYCDQVPHDII